MCVCGVVWVPPPRVCFCVSMFLSLHVCVRSCMCLFVYRRPLRIVLFHILRPRCRRWPVSSTLFSLRVYLLLYSTYQKTEGAYPSNQKDKKKSLPATNCSMSFKNLVEIHPAPHFTVGCIELDIKGEERKETSRDLIFDFWCSALELVSPTPSLSHPFFCTLVLFS